MKSLFGALLCFVLAQSQAWAISGGPVYPGAKANVVGSYAGVLQPGFCAEANPANCPALNSIGVFSLGVPSSGLGGGTFVMFTQGRVFSGAIQAVANPNSGSIQGVLTASYNFNKIASQTGVSFRVTASVRGNLKATVKRPSGAPTSAGALRGDATLYVDQGQITADNQPIFTGVLALTVNGVKQSDTAPTVTISTPAPEPSATASPASSAAPSD